MSTYYIGITVRQEGGVWAAIPSRSAPPIICGNPDAFGFTITFEGEWPDSDPAFARRTLRIVAISQEGEMHEYSTYSELSNNLTLDFPIHDAVRCMVYVTRGDRTTEIPAAIRCLPGITDNSGIEDNPRPDVYNLMCECIAQRRGGSQSAADALLDTLYALRETAPPAYPGDDYRLTAKRSERVTTVTGTLTLASGRVIQITDDMIVADSLRIKAEAISTDALLPGGVPSREIQATLRLGDVAKGDVYEARLALTYHIQRSDEHWREIDLGAFTVTEAKNPQPGYTKITGYDDMLKLTRLSRGEFYFGGRDMVTLYEAVTAITAEAGVAWDGEEEAFRPTPRLGNLSIKISEMNNGIETGRDLLGWIAQIITSTAIIDPHDGKLHIIPIDVHAPVESFTEGDSLSHTISSHEYRLFEIRGVKQQTAWLTHEITGPEKCIHHTLWSDGVTTDLPENPLFEATYEGVNRSTGDDIIWDIANRLDPVVFTPGEAELFGDPALQLLEWVIYRTEDGDASFPITRTEWSYRGLHKIESGGMEAIAGVEKSQAEKHDMGARIKAWTNGETMERSFVLMVVTSEGHSGMGIFHHTELAHFTHHELGTEGVYD